MRSIQETLASVAVLGWPSGLRSRTLTQANGSLMSDLPVLRSQLPADTGLDIQDPIGQSAEVFACGCPNLKSASTRDRPVSTVRATVQSVSRVNCGPARNFVAREPRNRSSFEGVRTKSGSASIERVSR